MLITGWPNSLLRLTRKSSVKVAAIVVLLAPVLLTVACGGGSSNPTAPLPVSVQVTPPTSSIVVGQSQTFAAVVKNSTAGVNWSVQEGSAGGSVTAAGVYTAPMKASTYHVIAASVTDPTKSATATVGVTAPAPAITSTAPAAANEGDVYTYALAATDPVNTAITFSLVSGPDGATLTGSTLTWTPTHVQSRANNAFKVSAVTSAGGSAAQNFSVTPLGTIRGGGIDTYVTAQGNVAVPEDLTTIYIGASFLNGNAWKTVDAIANADGTFEIHKVPAGNYWLAAASGGYWTSASDIDLGQNFLGRNDGLLPTAQTSMALAFTGLEPWESEDSIQIFNPNLSQSFDWSDNNNPGDTSSASLWDWTEPLSDAALGDAWYVTQVSEKEVGNGSWHYLAKSAPAISITQTDGSTTDLAGTLTDAPPIGMRLKIMGSQFAALAPSVGADAEVHSTGLGVYSQPFTATKGWIGFVQTLLESDGQEPITTDVDAGDVTFGNPFPVDWVPFVSLGYQLTVPYRASGAKGGVDVPAEIYISTTDLPTIDKPLAPVLTPVRNVKLNGTALTQAQSTGNIVAHPGVGLTHDRNCPQAIV